MLRWVWRSMLWPRLRPWLMDRALRLSAHDVREAAHYMGTSEDRVRDWNERFILTTIAALEGWQP